MPENVHARLPHRAQHPCSLIGRGPQRRMRSRDDQFEDGEFVRRHVHGAVGPDVGLDSLDDPEALRVALIERVDLAVLPSQIAHGHAVSDGQAVGVIGHGAVRVAAREATFGERLERVGTIAPGGSASGDRRGTPAVSGRAASDCASAAAT